ncbi:MAG: hypothetical protein HGB12_16300 [Bacteroidetes bacterium]|nr:hypothetical protein [Bacteroidota bacterium]
MVCPIRNTTISEYQTIEINDCFFNGKHPYLFTKEKFDEEKLKFSNNTENERFFSDKLNFKFKKLSPISEVFKLMRSSVKTEGNIDSYLIYKLLSQYVHFSNIAFNIDNNPETRKAELDQIEHILIFCYKMLLMHFDFFCRSYQIVLNNNKIKDFIDSKMKNV